MIRTTVSVLALMLAMAVPAAAQAPAASATLSAEKPGPVISRYIFSQFAEHIGSGIYGGLWVGADSPIPNTRGMRNDVLAALRRLHVPLVRWPGGCFADIYHWRDGIGPQDKRPARVNSHWGGILEPNHFGTHEFMDFVEAIGAEAYVNGNVGTSTPQETVEWVEYMTAPAGTLAEERARNGHPAPWKIAYWGVGNELWGCGGRMPVDYAAALTRQYSQFIKTPGGPVSILNFQRPVLVASGADAEDYAWTEGMMRTAGERFDALALHYYTIPDRKGAFGSGTAFDETSYARTLSRTLFMEELVSKHAAIMDRYDPGKRIGLAVDEWGVLTDVVPGHGPRSLFMQNSLRDALLAALNFNIFIRHADRVRMTSIAQMINVAQSMILTRDGEMVLTPTYHAFEMYVPFQDATALPLDIRTPDYAKGEWHMAAVSGVAARDRAGAVHVALTNVDPNHAVRTTVTLAGVSAKRVSGRVLTAVQGVTAHNDFGTPDVVAPRPFNDAHLRDGTLTVDLPPHSLVVLELGR
ncbi:alpha-N-arabinofuranosidase [Sphingomonas sp. R-74633]|uniref:alpha-N-arabinofuranosidase n=1 Tax=Sphingomonas sp. R-74633 TaxID=2751188 RepID=UPI0015D41431|nr:alpha-L-arabinofuranosidase C-terminal domain-containing protein [Sphingomonas sp. R-74633]NYT41926.1 alpha-N-arabinofuranosidase [Sphingomonas sp. R-74633]